MMSIELEKALESREVLRAQENGLDVRLYNTGQILAFGNVTKEKHAREGHKRIIEEIEVPVRVTYNLRTGMYSENHHGGGSSGGGYPSVPFFSEAIELLEQRGANLSKWKTPGQEDKSNLGIYPELTDFLEEIHQAFAGRKWIRHELAIKGFLPTLAGHGNIPPWALLHPKVMWAYVAGTVFPFERKDVFDFEKGRKSLGGRTEYMGSEEGVSYDGNVVLIRPWHFSQEDERDHTVIEAHFFNPVNYHTFLEGTLKVENHVPSRRDWKFEVTYGIEHGRKWLHFSADRFDDQHVQKEGLLDQKKNDVFLKVDDKMIDTFERIAPLPL